MRSDEREGGEEELLRVAILMHQERDELVDALRERCALFVLLQLCAAMAALQAEGVAHRDLKLNNVMLLEAPRRGAGPCRPGEAGPEIRLIDFGCATAGLFGRASDSDGNPANRAPELHVGRPAALS